MAPPNEINFDAISDNDLAALAEKVLSPEEINNLIGEAPQEVNTPTPDKLDIIGGLAKNAWENTKKYAPIIGGSGDSSGGILGLTGEALTHPKQFAYDTGKGAFQAGGSVVGLAGGAAAPATVPLAAYGAGKTYDSLMGSLGLQPEGRETGGFMNTVPVGQGGAMDAATDFAFQGILPAVATLGSNKLITGNVAGVRPTLKEVAKDKAVQKAASEVANENVYQKIGDVLGASADELKTNQATGKSFIQERVGRLAKESVFDGVPEATGKERYRKLISNLDDYLGDVQKNDPKAVEKLTSSIRVQKNLTTSEISKATQGSMRFDDIFQPIKEAVDESAGFSLKETDDAIHSTIQRVFNTQKKSYVPKATWEKQSALESQINQILKKEGKDALNSPKAIELMKDLAEVNSNIENPSITFSQADDLVDKIANEVRSFKTETGALPPIGEAYKQATGASTEYLKTWAEKYAPEYADAYRTQNQLYSDAAEIRSTFKKKFPGLISTITRKGQAAEVNKGGIKLPFVSAYFNKRGLGFSAREGLTSLLSGPQTQETLPLLSSLDMSFDTMAAAQGIFGKPPPVSLGNFAARRVLDVAQFSLIGRTPEAVKESLPQLMQSLTKFLEPQEAQAAMQELDMWSTVEDPKVSAFALGEILSKYPKLAPAFEPSKSGYASEVGGIIRSPQDKGEVIQNTSTAVKTRKLDAIKASKVMNAINSEEKLPLYSPIKKSKIESKSPMEKLLSGP